MSLIDLFKKNSSSPAPSPITKFDEKLPPLPPPPSMQGPVAPAAKAPMPSLPPLPAKATPAQAAPSLPPLPKMEPKPAPSLPPLPAMAPRPMAAPALPPLPPVPPPAHPAPKVETPRIEIPKISVEPPKQAPIPTVAPPAPALVPAEASKLENSRLAKALEELTSVDFELDEPVKAEAKAETKPEAKKVAPAPIVMKAAPLPPAGPKHKYVPMPVFDSMLRELKQVQQDLTETQSNNERLGMLENQKKNSYETIVSGFEHVQRQLLAIDEKLFKVN